MRMQIVLSLVTVCTIAQAMELRIGSATFNWKTDMGFARTDFDIDARVYSLSEQHNNFGDSRFYYFYNADLYQSDTADRVTDLITTPLTYDFPVVGSFNDAVAHYTSIPVPADYRIRGFDIDLGIGYDLFKDKKGVLGVGINTGLSIPVMKMKNLRKSAEVTYNLLGDTETTVKTWKLGPILHAAYRIFPKLLMYGSFTAGYQTGSIENDWIKSSLTVDGSYTALDLGMRFTPWQRHKDLGWIRLDPKLFVTAGYSQKNWTMERVSVDAFNVTEFSSGGFFKNSFSNGYWYIGVGYDF